MTPTTDQQPQTQALAVQPTQRPPLRELLGALNEAGPEIMQAYARDIIDREVAIAKFDQDWRLARVFSDSELFGDAKGIAQAMTKIQLGRSWSMSESDAMQHIYFVNGKPAVQNEYMAAKMRDAGLDWKIQWHRDAAGACIGCTLFPSRFDGKNYIPLVETEMRDGKLVDVQASVSFTKADADRVRVKEDGKWIKLSEKSTYESWAQDMYFWRAIARLRRRYATNILSGVRAEVEVQDQPEIVEPKLLPAAAPLVTDPTEFVPKNTRRAGKADMPVTPAQEKKSADSAPADPAPAAEVIAGIANSTTAAATPEPAKEAAAAPSTTGPAATAPATTAVDTPQPDAELRANLLAQLNALRTARTDEVFVPQWASLKTSYTVEGMNNMLTEKIQKALVMLQQMGDEIPKPKRLFE